MWQRAYMSTLGGVCPCHMLHSVCIISAWLVVKHLVNSICQPLISNIHLYVKFFVIFPFLGLYLCFHLFTSDVECSKSYNQQKENGFNLNPSFSLKWRAYVETCYQEIIHFIKWINHGHSSELQRLGSEKPL